MAHAKLFTDTREIKMETDNYSYSIAVLCEGYVNNAMSEEGGVTAMNGKLNIRPRYQRLYIRENDNMWITHRERYKAFGVCLSISPFGATPSIII